MSADRPAVDINLFVYNGAETIGEAIESILAQTWPSITLTIFDNGSTDGTPDIVRGYTARAGWIHLKRNRANVGAVANCQRAFWHGDADFVMPKTADDLIAPDYVERLMVALLERPDCVMCHAGGLVFTGQGCVREVYPPEHRLLATGPDPVERARHVMARYTSAPSFWGIYRRAAVDRLLRIPYRAGWDHAVLAELALYGEIRYIPEVLYWRRNGGAPVSRLARECTAYAQRGLPMDDALADLGWRTPLITTAYNHLEVFALARVAPELRPRLMALAVQVFRGRWLSLMRREAALFRTGLPALLAALERQDGVVAGMMARHLTEALTAIETMLPEEDFTLAHLEIATLTSGRRHCDQATMPPPPFAGVGSAVAAAAGSPA
jgi:glycosyltransferase involved in cell wall biosynthesis